MTDWVVVLSVWVLSVVPLSLIIVREAYRDGYRRGRAEAEREQWDRE